MGTESVACEVGHSQIRRFVKLKVQTHVVHLEGLSTQWVGQHFRHFVDGSSRPRAQASGSDDPAAEEVPPVGQRDRQSPAGSGGAWRASVRMQASNDLRAVGEAYRELGPVGDSMRPLREEGRDASLRAREGQLGSDETSFGPKRRKFRWGLERRLANARVADAIADDDSTRCEAVAQLLEDAVVGDQPLAEVVKAARRLDKALLREEREQYNADRAAIATWIAEQAPRFLQAASGTLGVEPNSAALRCCTARASGLGVPTLATRHGAAATEAAMLVEQLDKQKACNLGPALDRRWARLHRLLGERPDLKAAGKADQGPVNESPCWTHGACVCKASPGGVHLYNFHALACKASRQLFTGIMLSGGVF